MLHIVDLGLVLGLIVQTKKEFSVNIVQKKMIKNQTKIIMFIQTLKKRSLQHRRFPGGHPSKY